jgi:hypothetical protein
VLYAQVSDRTVREGSQLPKLMALLAGQLVIIGSRVAAMSGSMPGWWSLRSSTSKGRLRMARTPVRAAAF